MVFTDVHNAILIGVTDVIIHTDDSIYIIFYEKYILT